MRPNFAYSHLGWKIGKISENHLFALTKDHSVQKLSSLSSFQLRPSENVRNRSLNLVTSLISRSCLLAATRTKLRNVAIKQLSQLISAPVDWPEHKLGDSGPWATPINPKQFIYDCSWNENKTFIPTTSQHRVFIHFCLRFPLTEQIYWHMPTKVMLHLV